MTYPNEVSDAQRKAYAENDADFAKLAEELRAAQEKARLRLIDSGRFEDPDSTYCYRCSCPEYLDEFPHGSCARGTCRHALGSHHGFI